MNATKCGNSFRTFIPFSTVKNRRLVRETKRGLHIYPGAEIEFPWFIGRVAGYPEAPQRGQKPHSRHVIAGPKQSHYIKRCDFGLSPNNFRRYRWVSWDRRHRRFVEEKTLFRGIDWKYQGCLAFFRLFTHDSYRIIGSVFTELNLLNFWKGIFHSIQSETFE